MDVTNWINPSAVNVCRWPIALKVNTGPDVRYGEAKPTFVLRCNRRLSALISPLARANIDGVQKSITSRTPGMTARSSRSRALSINWMSGVTWIAGVIAKL